MTQINDSTRKPNKPRGDQRALLAAIDELMDVRSRELRLAQRRQHELAEAKRRLLETWEQWRALVLRWCDRAHVRVDGFGLNLPEHPQAAVVAQVVARVRAGLRDEARTRAAAAAKEDQEITALIERYVATTADMAADLDAALADGYRQPTESEARTAQQLRVVA